MKFVSFLQIPQRLSRPDTMTRKATMSTTYTMRDTTADWTSGYQGTGKKTLQKISLCKTCEIFIKASLNQFTDLQIRCQPYCH